MGKMTVRVMFTVCVGLFIWGCSSASVKPSNPAQTLAPVAAPGPVEKVKVELYVMSKCPFGILTEVHMLPVLQKMGKHIDFSLEFIGRVRDGQLKSLHKEAEVKGDLVQICAGKHAPDSYFEFIGCMNKTYRDIPENWEPCAAKSGLPAEKIRACADGSEGKELLTASFDRAKARKAVGSPTMYVDNKLYQGGRTEVSFSRAICAAFEGGKPRHCATLPPPVKFAITILNDRRCSDCRTGVLENQLQSIFPAAEITVVDYGSAEGKKLYAELGMEKLPILLFGKEVKAAENYSRFRRALKPHGEKLVHARWARFNPTREICDNHKDDDANGKVDCADPYCTYDMICRQLQAKKLEVFVMSQCPYAVRALNSMKEVLDNFDNQIDFQVNFIATEKDGGFVALHGQPEVDENIRELCAIKYYGQNYKFMDYILCRNKNVLSPDWKSCTGKSTGIDAQRIEKCASGKEGPALLRENIKIAAVMKVAGSPTWYANNKFRFTGLDAETIKRKLCQHNQGLRGCKNTLSGAPQ